MTVKTYYESSGKHVSSSICASVNFFDRLKGPELAALHESMRQELGEHVIIDGSDDWGAKPERRPETFFREFAKDTGAELLAYYHSKTSGVTKSGIVVKPEDFDAMTEWYEAKFGVRMEQNLKLTFHSNSTAA